jgi:hypothetical protein
VADRTGTPSAAVGDVLLTTRERDLVRLGLPDRRGQVVALALRYPSTLHEVYLTVLDAQRAWGLRLEGRGRRRAGAGEGSGGDAGGVRRCARPIHPRRC